MERRPPAVLAVALLALACRGKPPEPPTPSNPYLRLPRQTRQYTTIWNSGEPSAYATRTTETWGPATQVGRLAVRTIESREVQEGQPDRVERMKVFVDRGAFGLYSSTGANGEERYDPPEVVMPAQPRVGQRWGGEHRHGGRVIRRTCELVVFEGCPRGLSADCHSRMEQATVHQVEHFCPGIGWIGEDASVFNARGRVATTIGAVIQDGEPVSRSLPPRPAAVAR